MTTDAMMDTDRTISENAQEFCSGPWPYLIIQLHLKFWLCCSPLICPVYVTLATPRVSYRGCCKLHHFSGKSGKTALTLYLLCMYSKVDCELVRWRSVQSLYTNILCQVPCDQSGRSKDRTGWKYKQWRTIREKSKEPKEFTSSMAQAPHKWHLVAKRCFLKLFLLSCILLTGISVAHFHAN